VLLWETDCCHHGPSKTNAATKGLSWCCCSSAARHSCQHCLAGVGAAPVFALPCPYYICGIIAVASLPFIDCALICCMLSLLLLLLLLCLQDFWLDSCQ
jgi:hypothetical protein